MTCTGGNLASCSRIRGGLQFYSCSARVSERLAGANTLVDEIHVFKIKSAGL